MNARRVAAITVRLLAQFRHDPRTLALMFVAPLLILSLFWFLLRGGGGRPAMGVVNEDQGPLGAAVVAQLERSSQVDASQLDAATASRRLADGSLAGYVVLPPDFSRALQQQRSPDMEVHLEGSQPSSSSSVLGASQAALAGTLGISARPQVSYLHGAANLDTLDYFGVTVRRLHDLLRQGGTAERLASQSVLDDPAAMAALTAAGATSEVASEDGGLVHRVTVRG